MTPEEIKAKLQAPFPADEVEWRTQSCGISKDGKPWAKVLGYIQARAIQRRLDEVFGWDNWEEEYRQLGNDVICRLSVTCDGKRISKENGASNTDIEAFKGGISGAFKRVAASGYGIGRYLYSLEESFAECSLTKVQGYNMAKTKDKQTIYWKEPQLPAWALPEGSRPNTKASQNKPATGQPDGSDMGTETTEQPPAQFTEKPISEAQMKKISTLCGQLLINEPQGKELLKEKYQKSSCKELTSKQASGFIDYLIAETAKKQNLKLAVGDALGEATYPRGYNET